MSANGQPPQMPPQLDPNTSVVISLVNGMVLVHFPQGNEVLTRFLLHKANGIIERAIEAAAKDVPPRVSLVPSMPNLRSN